MLLAASPFQKQLCNTDPREFRQSTGFSEAEDFLLISSLDSNVNCGRTWSLWLFHLVKFSSLFPMQWLRHPVVLREASFKEGFDVTPVGHWLDYYTANAVVAHRKWKRPPSTWYNGPMVYEFVWGAVHEAWEKKCGMYHFLNGFQSKAWTHQLHEVNIRVTNGYTGASNCALFISTYQGITTGCANGYNEGRTFRARRLLLHILYLETRNIRPVTACCLPLWPPEGTNCDA